jgi:hypothetical protein
MGEEPQPRTSVRRRAIAALRELVEALDRRVPQIGRVAETRIARDASALRAQAMRRIDELRTASDAPARDAALAVMADDGGPALDDERREPTRGGRPRRR